MSILSAKPLCECGGRLRVKDSRTHNDGKIHRSIKCDDCGAKSKSVEISLEEYEAMPKLDPKQVAQWRRAYEILKDMQAFLQEP